MGTDSTTPGYLGPLPPEPLYDRALEDMFQGVIRGLTGLPGNLVRPRWQPDPPNQPAVDVTWLAFGVTVGSLQWNAYQKFDPTLDPPNGAYVVEGAEELRLNLSFYGPGGKALLGRFAAGIQLDQNLEELRTQNIKFVGLSASINLPALLKEMWTLRTDMSVTFTRWGTRTYPIKSLVSAIGGLNNEFYVEPISVTPPSE